MRTVSQGKPWTLRGWGRWTALLRANAWARLCYAWTLRVRSGDSKAKKIIAPLPILVPSACPNLPVQFDSFELDRVSGGRPLSCLAFHLIRKMDITKQLQLSETRLCK